MTDEMQLARARKHSLGYAEYLKARAKLEADKPAPRTEPTGLDVLAERRPELLEAAAKIAALNPGLAVAGPPESEAS